MNWRVTVSCTALLVAACSGAEESSTTGADDSEHERAEGADDDERGSSTSASEPERSDWGHTIDPATLDPPWAEDHTRCLAEAEAYYDASSLDLVQLRDSGAHRFLYYLEPDEVSREEVSTGQHVGCRVSAEDGELLILHGG